MAEQSLKTINTGTSDIDANKLRKPGERSIEDEITIADSAYIRAKAAFNAKGKWSEQKTKRDRDEFSRLKTAASGAWSELVSLQEELKREEAAKPAKSVAPAPKTPKTGTAAETITDGGTKKPIHEQKGSEMSGEEGANPSQQPRSKQKRGPSQGPPEDLIDIIATNYGKIRSHKLMRPGEEGYYTQKYRESIAPKGGYGRIRSLYSNTKGSGLDQIVDNLRRDGYVGPGFTVDDLHDKLIADAEARRQWRPKQAHEKDLQSEDERTRDELQRIAVENKRGPGEHPATEPIKVSNLIEGTEFELDGVKVKVKEFHFDGEEPTTVLLEDGRRFGAHRIGVDTIIHIDKGTEVKPKFDFVSDEEIEAANAEKAKADEEAAKVKAEAERLKAEAEKGKAKKKPSEDLFGADAPFNLVGETQEAPAPKKEAKKPSTPEDELLHVEPDKKKETKSQAEQDADKAEKIYGSTEAAIKALKRQLDVIAKDKKFAKTYKAEEIKGFKDALAELQRRAGEEPPLAQRTPGRTSPKRGRFSLWDADEGDLADFFEERFGDQGGRGSPFAAGRTGTFQFRDYDQFRDWMKARYDERDLEGMRIAFAEADTQTKVRFVKEMRKIDPHLKAWIDHIATGAPLPKESPPVPRTTPRPNPGAPPPRPGAPAGGTPPPRQPGRQQPPPPPPRPNPNAPGHVKFDGTALVQLFKKFGEFPRVNTLLKHLGVFKPGENAVELKLRLFWDKNLAERVLGHEIGHFIDYVISAIGKGKQFAQKVKPLYSFRGKLFEAQDLRNEARNLSRQWRGNFFNGDKYRDTANELFADFMSAMFNKPEWVNQNFPLLFDAFAELRRGKPEFDAAYMEIQSWLRGDTMADELRKQDLEAVRRTQEIMLDPRHPSKARWYEKLRFATFSMWHRAFQAEGKPRSLGTSIAEELEYSRSYAAMENALFSDDVKKTVDPHLQLSHPGNMEQARADLMTLAKAERTLSEVRAGGQWIKDNPDEAREVLTHILDIDGPLRAKWDAALSSATDTELYDLSGAIFRDIHDRGERFVNHMAKEIDGLRLGIGGEAALNAFNVRSKLLNPGGLNEDMARKLIQKVATQLGPTRFAELKLAADNLRDLLYEVQSKMHDEGLISDRVWKELIEPNKGNYVPYAVLDYFEGHVRAGVLKQKGTAKDVADILTAVELKVAASNGWRQKQRQVQMLRDAWIKGGNQGARKGLGPWAPNEIGEALRNSKEIERIRDQHLEDDISRAVMWVDGKPHLVEFPGDPGKLIEKALDNPSFYEHTQWLAEASDFTHKLMQFYTTFNVPFMLWRNPIRGLRTAALKSSFLEIAKQNMTPKELRANFRMARNYAQAAFGGVMTPEVRALVESQTLMPPRLSSAMISDIGSMAQLMTNHGILANQVRNMKPGSTPKWWKGGEIPRKTQIATELAFTTYEAFEKIYNYKAALARGLTPEAARSLARRSGIPNPGITGKWGVAAEVFFPWTRVHLQGMRASYDMLRSPEARAGFATRFMLSEGLPRVMKWAIATGAATGAIKWAMNSKQDPNDSVMGEFMRRVSPYKMALDDIVPLYFYDPRSDEIHALWSLKKGSDVPRHWEAVSLRLPASEEGRLWGTLLYNVLIGMPGAQDKAGRPGQNLLNNIYNWGKGYLVPQISPLVQIGSNVGEMAAGGINPNDPYRNQPAANQRMFDAGGAERTQAILGYLANQTGSVGELAGIIAANMGLLDERALNAVSHKMPGDHQQMTQRMPFLKTALSHDNYAQYREEKIPELADKQMRDKSRLLMSEEARGLYDYYYQNLKRKDKMTVSELVQFALARGFVEKIFGSAKREGSFYNAAMHAVGPDGSREAKKTFTRDLDLAAAPSIAAFKEARKNWKELDEWDDKTNAPSAKANNE